MEFCSYHCFQIEKKLNSLRLANLSFHAAQVQKEGMLRFQAGIQKMEGHSGEATGLKRIINIDTRVGPGTYRYKWGYSHNPL